MNRYHHAIVGIVAVTLLCIAEILLSYFLRNTKELTPSPAPVPEVFVVTFTAFGDVNLGRAVGQKILNGDIHYPFRFFSIADDSSDIVFANLESQISDQKGETVHPRFNLIFTAPPEAVATLQQSGIDILSTANNHAVDYGISALHETIDRLQNANIRFIGTSRRKENLYQPLVFEENNIKFAIFAVTSFVNMTFPGWRDFVAVDDTIRLLPELKNIRDSVDVIIMSYHGGAEYVARPTLSVRRFADWCVENGVDLFLGHHPHVTFGVQRSGRSLIVHSLGNFVFFQPQKYWTQRSYGIKFLITKKDTTAVDIARFIPLDVSLQTRRLIDTSERKKLYERTQQLSNFDLSPYWQ